MSGTCMGSGASMGGVQGGRARDRTALCPVCGRQVAMRPGRAGRLYPHAPTAAWVVGTMDDGIICRAMTKSECYRWIAWQHVSPIASVRRCGPGDYEVLVYAGVASMRNYWVMRPDVAARHGFEVEDDQ